MVRMPPRPERGAGWAANGRVGVVPVEGCAAGILEGAQAGQWDNVVRIPTLPGTSIGRLDDEEHDVGAAAVVVVVSAGSVCEEGQEYE